MKKKYTCLIIFFLVVISLAAFGRIANNGFILTDDPEYITQNPHIKSGINLESIQWAFSSVVLCNWHPLTFISYMADWHFFGANAGGHHLVNLVLHIGAAVLLFLFLYKTTHRLWPAAFAAFFFAVHPLRVESIAWASERKDVLSMLFGMATLYAYAFYIKKTSFFRYVFCLALFVLSLLSKPMLVTLPFLLMLLDYWPLKRWQKALTASAESRSKPAIRLVGEKAPFIFLSLASSVVTLWAQRSGEAVASAETLPFITRAANAVVSYVAYLKKTFWPFDLAFFYPYEFSPSLGKTLGAAAILILITAAVFYWLKKRPYLFSGWFWYLGTLIPVIGLVQIGTQAMADRYTYLPSIGIAIMLAWGIPSLIKSEKNRKILLFPAAVAIIAGLSVLTFHQCGFWKDSLTLLNHTLAVTQNNDRIHYKLGLAYFEKGNLEKALNHYTEAIRLTPDRFGYYYYYHSRARAYARAGKDRQAIKDYSAALRLKPDCAKAYYNRGIIYGKRLGRYKRALDDFNRTIRFDAQHIKAYNNRGLIHSVLGQYQSAIDDFDKAVSLAPDYADAYNNRAFAYLKEGNRQACCRDARQACRLGNCKMLKAAQKKGFCP